MDKPILIVHPNDPTTIFLDRIKGHLVGLFDKSIHHFNVYPNDNSHEECLKRISSHPENGMVIFLGHGRSDRLYGGKGKMFKNRDEISREIQAENPDDYYINDDFINQDNIDVFDGKLVFCLACNSNSKVAKWAMDKGARSFFGFGDIPTSTEEFVDDGMENVSGDIVRVMKTELNYIIKRSLEISIKEKYSFRELKNIMEFIVNQRITDILINEKRFKDRYLLADYLYHLKKEALILGDKLTKIP